MADLLARCGRDVAWCLRLGRVIRMVARRQYTRTSRKVRCWPSQASAWNSPRARSQRLAGRSICSEVGLARCRVPVAAQAQHSRNRLSVPTSTASGATVDADTSGGRFPWRVRWSTSGIRGRMCGRARQGFSPLPGRSVIPQLRVVYWSSKCATPNERRSA